MAAPTLPAALLPPRMELSEVGATVELTEVVVEGVSVAETSVYVDLKDPESVFAALLVGLLVSVVTVSLTLVEVCSGAELVVVVLVPFAGAVLLSPSVFLHIVTTNPPSIIFLKRVSGPAYACLQASMISFPRVLRAVAQSELHNPEEISAWEHPSTSWL